MVNLFLVVILAFPLAVSTKGLPRPINPRPTRIVGGENAERGDIPFQIRILYSGSHICGGSVLSQGIIVTAAQCSTGSIANYSIVAGDLDTNVNEGFEQTREIDRIVIHENFDDWDLSNDIALMFLSEPLYLNEYIQPIAIPNRIYHIATGNAVVSGWGSTSEGGEAATILQKATVPIISDAECRKVYGNDQIRNSVICAGGGLQGGLDACQGDLGGPMTASDIGTRYLAGIISWGFGCARPGYPGVYTEVSHFLNWIDRQV